MAKRISVIDVLNDLNSMPTNMYAVVEMNGDLSDDGEPVAIIRQTFNFDEAVGVARQCRRPYIDIIAKTAKGLRWMSWVASNPRRKAKRTRGNPGKDIARRIIWEKVADGTYRIELDASSSLVIKRTRKDYVDYDLDIALYKPSWEYYIIKNGKAIHSGISRTLQEAKDSALFWALS